MQNPHPPSTTQQTQVYVTLRSSCGQQLTEYTNSDVVRHAYGFATLMLVSKYLIYTCQKKRPSLVGQQTLNQTALTSRDEQMNPEVVNNHSTPSGGQQRETHRGRSLWKGKGGHNVYLQFRLLTAVHLCWKLVEFTLKVIYTWPHVQMSWNKCPGKKKTKHTTTLITMSKKPKLNKLQCTLDKTQNLKKNINKKNYIKFKQNIEKKAFQKKLNTGGKEET